MGQLIPLIGKVMSLIRTVGFLTLLDNTYFMSCVPMWDGPSSVPLSNKVVSLVCAVGFLTVLHTTYFMSWILMWYGAALSFVK